MADTDELDLTDEEQQAFHELQLGIEHLYRGYGSLLTFHHTIGHGMDHLDTAESVLREAGHEETADRLRNEILPAGVFEGIWTYEVVEAFRRNLLADVTDFAESVRGDLADGKQHITEREQQQAWRERADSESYNR